MLLVNEKNNGVIFNIRVQPGANQTMICGLHNQALKIKIRQKPEDGAANLACQKYLAKVLNIKKSQIELVAGHKSRNKIIMISQLNKETLLLKLKPFCDRGEDDGVI